jgi:autotransporter-associated beta strand protein
MTLAGSGTGKLTLSAANTFSGGFILNSGRSVNIDDNTALGTGTFTINGGTVDATTSARTITNAIVIAGSFRFLGTQNLTQNTGAITLNATPNILVSANTLSLGGIISGSFGITKSGSGSLVLTAANTFSGLTTVSAGTLKLNRSGGSTIPASNNVTVSGGTLQIATNQTINDLTLTGGTLQVDAGATLTINGTYTGGGTIVNNGKIVLTAASAFPGSSTTISAMNDLEVNRAAGVTLNNNLFVSGTLTLTSGTLDIGSQTLTLSAGISRTAGTITASSGTLVFTNNIAQTLPSSMFSGNINNLTLNGSGGITLGNAPTLTGTLTLTSGVLTTTSSNLLTLASGAGVSGVSNSSFVHGPVKKVGNTDFTFPVGSIGTGYQPIQITNFAGTTSPSDAFTAEYKRSSAAGVGTNINSPVNRVSFCEYWQLDRTTGTPTVDVTLHFNTNSGCGGGVPADYLAGNSGLLSELRVCRWDGSQWVNYTTSYSGTAPNVTITAAGISSFSPFTVGSTGMAPLPLKLLAFNGIKKEGKVHLNWTTLDETNMKSIVLQSSSDGEIVEKVTELLAQNTLHNHYTFTDTSDMMKRTYQSQNHRYYRLEFVNLDQSVEQSSWISVTDNELIKIKPQFRVYPNPTNGNSIYVDPIATGPTLATIKLTDNTGKLILHENANFRNPYKFPVDGLKTGLYYLMVILSDGSVENHKIIIQP